MSSTPSEGKRQPPKIDLEREIAGSYWKNDPLVGFDQRASLTIARWIFVIFGGVYALGFVGAFILLTWKDATFERGSDLVKFLVQLPLPLVTLAVGYYLGDRNRQPPTKR
jgi:hypothetical protein